MPDKTMPNSLRLKKLTLAQISDSHLFADRTGLHHQANVYQNLTNVLLAIKNQPSIDAIIFTGDLTQDHTLGSYQLFVSAFEACEIITPVYFIAGNHDEPTLLSRYLSHAPFCQDSIIENDDWQVLLLESKSGTPAGEISKAQFDILGGLIDPSKAQLLLMHHHPVDVGYFIDKHGLINQAEFQQFLTDFPSIKAVGCGHIHQALTLSVTLEQSTVSIYSCPATSIQFDINSLTAKSNGQPPGYRLFTLASNGEFTSTVHFV